MVHLGLPMWAAGGRPTASARPGSSRVTVRRNAHPRPPDDRGYATEPIRVDRWRNRPKPPRPQGAVGPDRHPGPPRACLLTGFASSAPHRRHPHGNLTLDGVLVRPSRAVLEVLAAAVTDGSLRPVVDQVLELADAAVAHRRVESRRGQGKVVLRVAG